MPRHKDKEKGKYFPITQDMMVSMSAEFKKLRELQGYTVAEMSDKIKIGVGSYSRMENGKYPISMQRFLELSIIFKKDPVELLRSVLEADFIRTEKWEKRNG